MVGFRGRIASQIELKTSAIKEKSVMSRRRTWLPLVDEVVKNDGEGGGIADVDRALRFLCGRDGVE
jgi:hypothetical protein